MSGCIKRTLLDFRDTEAQRFVLGLIIGGIITSSVIPWSYETSSPGGAQGTTLKALAAGVREPKTPS